MKSPRIDIREFPDGKGVIGALTVAGVVALILLVTTVDPWLHGAGILSGSADLHVYRDGAFRAVQGLPLYTDPVSYGLLYTYTPFSTLAFIGLDQIPGHYVDQIWMGMNLCVLLACVLLSWRMLGYRITPRLIGVSTLLTLTCTFLEPVRTTLFYGQINLVLMLLVLWGFSRTQQSRFRGVGVGVAAGIKLTPGYFIATLVTLRQWRAAATASATFAATVAVAWAVLPHDSWQYWTSTFFQSTRIADDSHPANQSLRGTIAHLTGQATPMWLWLALAGGVAVTSLFVVVQLHERGDRLLALMLSGITASAVSPYSWSHHWVWFVPLLVYLVHRAITRPRWWAAAAALFVPAGAWTHKWSEDNVVIGAFLFPPEWQITTILLDVYILIYACVLGAVIAMLVRSYRRAPEPDLEDHRTLPAVAEGETDHQIAIPASISPAPEDLDPAVPERAPELLGTIPTSATRPVRPEDRYITR